MAFLVFIYQLWEDKTRPEISKIYGVSPNQVVCTLMGDVRHVRNDIIHHQGKASNFWRLEMLPMIWPVQSQDWVFSDRMLTSLVEQINALRVEVSFSED